MPFIEDAALPWPLALKHGDSIFANTHLSSSMGANGACNADALYSVNTVAQALEVARESEEGARDPQIQTILEHALNDIWAKLQAQPTSYVMTRDEFAVFNYFQHRFVGVELAIVARRRYWDAFQANSNSHT